MPESASKRFARLIEDGSSKPGHNDALGRELAVVAALREVGRSTRLDDVTRLRIRQRLVTEFAELPNEPVAAPRRPSAAGGLRGRLVVAAAAALCLLLSLSGMSLVLARDALPGDALYGVKRSAESAELGFTFGVESRGFKHLQFATARVDEIEALAARTGGLAPNGDSGRFLTALKAFEADAAAGSRLLIESATNGDGSRLATLRGWAEQQRQRIETTAGVMPTRAAERATGSVQLMRKIAQRVIDLQLRLTCLSVTSGAVDDVGLLPAETMCMPQPADRPEAGTRPPAEQDHPLVGQSGQPGFSTPESASAAPTIPLGPEQGNPSAASPQPAQPPLLPVPSPPNSAQPTIVIPLPILPPIVTVPPLAPGLPGLRVG